LQYGRNKYVQEASLYREYLLEDVVYSLQSEYLTTTPLTITSDIFLTPVGTLYPILTMSPFLYVTPVVPLSLHRLYEL
jgi:hypothetical protein